MSRRRIIELVAPVVSWSPAQEMPDSDFVYIDIGSIDRIAKAIVGPALLRGAEAPSRARQKAAVGDVLVSTVRPGLNAVALVPPELDGATASTGFTVLRPISDRLDSRYLFYWVRHPQFIEEMERRATGASYPAVSDSIVKDSRVRVPGLEEQRRIAAILDEADALRRKRQEALVLLDKLLQSTFIEMFGDPLTNPRGWPTVRMRELVVEGPTNGLYRPASDYGRGTPIVRIDSFYDGQITDISTLKRVAIEPDLVQRYHLEPGQILVNRVNSPEHLGKTAIVPSLQEPTVFESNMMRVTVDRGRVEPEFVVHQMRSPFLRRQIATCAKDAVNQSSINQEDVRSFELRLPPMALQRRWMDVLEAQREEVRRCRSSSATLDHLFSSLLHRAFTTGL